MTPDEEFTVDRRGSTWTERHWKKASLIAGLLVVFATCSGVTLSWMGINLGDFGPGARFNSIEQNIDKLRIGQDTIAQDVVAGARATSILGVMLCTTPTPANRPPPDARARRLCDAFLRQIDAELMP